MMLVGFNHALFVYLLGRKNTHIIFGSNRVDALRLRTG